MQMRLHVHVTLCTRATWNSHVLWSQTSWPQISLIHTVAWTLGSLVPALPLTIGVTLVGYLTSPCL